MHERKLYWKKDKSSSPMMQVAVFLDEDSDSPVSVSNIAPHDDVIVMTEQEYLLEIAEYEQRIEDIRSNALSVRREYIHRQDELINSAISKLSALGLSEDEVRAIVSSY